MSRRERIGEKPGPLESEAPTSATVAKAAREAVDDGQRALFAKLDEADRLLALGTLAVGVAHEINTPLAYLMMNLELVAREIEPLFEGGAAPIALASALSDARDGAARVSAIVRELRAISSPREDRSGPVDVRAVIASSARIVDHEVRGRARLITAYSENLPDVIGDASRLGQVLLNLLLNAAQALPEGGPARHEIRVSARAIDDRSTVEISVEDTGPGIPEALLARVFLPFFTTKPSGTGLGLAVCHRIVAALGGEIAAANSPDGGARITVRLPAAPASMRRQIDAAEVEPALRRRLLLVDDEENFGKLVGSLLRPEHEVVSVTRARAALEILASGATFDAILCDLAMPEMNGSAFYEAIAAEWPELAARMIFMTGGTFTSEAAAFLERVENPRLHKPFSTAALLEALDSALLVRR